MSTTTPKKDSGTSSGITVKVSPHGLASRETMSIESKRLSPMTHVLRDQSTGFPLAIFKQISTSTSTTPTRTQPPPSLITMVWTTLTTLLLVTVAGLLQVSTMLMDSSTLVTCLQLAAIVTYVISLLRTVRVLMGLSRLSLGATKGKKKLGLVNLI
jgi:hypothetical protein